MIERKHMIEIETVDDRVKAAEQRFRGEMGKEGGKGRGR